MAPGIEGINGVELSNAMYLSTWLNTTVAVPVDPDLYYEKLQERIAQSQFSKEASPGKVLDVEGTY